MPKLQDHADARSAIHPDLESVTLLDIDDLCAVSRLSKSYVLDEVAKGRGPKPIRFGTRCTRYRLIDVREWLAARIISADSDGAAAAAVTARAAKAGRESRTRRRQRAGAAQPEGSSVK